MTVLSKNSIRRPFIISMVCIIVAIMLIYSTTVIFFMVNRIQGRIEKSLSEACHLAQTILSTALWQFNDVAVENFLDSLFMYEDIIFVKVVSGDVVQKQRARDGYQKLDSNSILSGNSYEVRKMDIQYNGKSIGRFEVIGTRHRIKRAIFTTILGSGLLMLTLVAAIFISIYFVTRHYIFKPLLLLEATAGKISEGDMETEFDIKSVDEFGHLARSFDHMLKRLKEMTASRDELNLQIQERIKTSEKLKKTQMQLIQTEKVGALGILTAGVAHELNNPLMGMINFIQYALKKMDPSDKLYTVLQDAEKSTLDCINIVGSLLRFSRITPSERKEWSKARLRDIFDSILKLTSHRIKTENICIEIHQNPDTPLIEMVRSDLQQVFLNILGNAMDAVRDRQEKKITIDIIPDHDAVLITVTDTGNGIDRKDLPKVFDPFFTTKPVGKGTGLGLSVSMGIIQDHKGHIKCSSEIGAGTSVEIRLPKEQ